ncbi:MAG: AAA family ATPase [Clostridia bacterium]|nr:AAA family ATPase [Clostridia bacterium]
MKKTNLLELIIKRAAESRKSLGLKEQQISLNDFVLSVLEIVDEKPEAIMNNSADKQELELLEKELGKYKFVRKAAITGLKDAIKEMGDKSTASSFVFKKIDFVLETKARKEGRGEIDSVMYLSQIFAEPTEEMSRLVLNGSTKKPTDIKKTATKAEKIDEIPEKSGVDRLAVIVENTRKIQNTLLENVFGQDEAIDTFVSGYFQSELMAYTRKENKPKATFLFAGPPGVGKTFLSEKVAEALGLPFRRFDMSEYCEKEANLEFCGSDKVYKNGSPGNVTDFVDKNPNCVLLFDEIEKAHLNVIQLFLQMLDAGRLRDNYTDKEVSFKKAIVIFTTNAGKNLYDDTTVTNLSALPKKTIMSALSKDKHPSNDGPLFPSAICSRFASGNVVMFNRLGANELYTIAERELDKNLECFVKENSINIEVDDKVPAALMLAEGGKADARTVKSRANNFFHGELYELFRLLSSDGVGASVKNLKKIIINVSLEDSEENIVKMFVNTAKPQVLVFAEKQMAASCKKRLKEIGCHVADDIEKAKEILFNYDINAILCDLNCKEEKNEINYLNIEDIRSEGREFLNYVLARYSTPVYLIRENEKDISSEEFLSFAKMGVRGIITVNDAFLENVKEKCDIAYQQHNMQKLAKANKVLTFKTVQSISKDKTTAQISMFDFKLAVSTDTDDTKGMLDDISKPNVKFDDVIGANDAKDELKYFVEYLKDPIKFMRKGVRAPRGVLLYGPPGTGKTMLAKAMAGESDVTFITAEGNQFLKSYVGEGSEAVHKLFRTARKYAPSILFIDEIDAIGKNRTGDTNTSIGDTLTALLTELDGFNVDTTKPVFVLAATNFSVDGEGQRSLDPALLRRFDRRIYVDLPNREEREKYLNMKISKNANVQLSQEQIENIAIRSTGMSLADLESIFEMALRNSIRQDSGVVNDAAFDEAFETFQSGEKKTWDPSELERTARHEAGHALVCWLSGEKPSYLTIVARDDHGGYMMHNVKENKGTYQKSELLDRIRVSLAGRASEILYYGREKGIDTGASGDLHNATQRAERMICNYGMDPDIGLVYLPKGAETPEVRAKIKEILDVQLEIAIDQLSENKEALDKLVEALIQRNHLKENEIDEILSKYAKQ